MQRNPCAVLVNTEGLGKIQNVRPIYRYIVEAVNDWAMITNKIHMYRTRSIRVSCDDRE